MKICYLANARSAHTVKWANHFRSMGHEVDVISREPPEGLRESIRTHRLPSRWPFKFDYFAGSGEVRCLLRQIRPDLLHAHYASGYGTLGRLAGFHPFILSIWGSDIFEFPHRSPLHKLLIQSNLSAADWVCATSRIMAAEVGKYCERLAVVTPFGIDCEQFKPAAPTEKPNDDFVLGTVKGLESNSGVDYFLRAVQLLVEKHPRGRLRIIIVGDGPRRQDFEKLAERLGLAPLVTFVGHVRHDEVPKYMKRFSVYISLSLAESFGVAVLEACACGVPVVVSNVGGLPEVLDNGKIGFLVPPRDIPAAAAILERLYTDGELRRRSGQQGRSWVMDHYEWSSTARIMEDLYRKAVAGASGR